MINDFLSKSRSSFIVLIIVLLRLLNNNLLRILRLLVELRWIVSWLRRSIVVNWLPIALILNRLVLISLVWGKWSTGWIILRLSKLWWNWVFNGDRNFLFFSLLICRWCVSIINNNRLLLINNISSSVSSNALYNAKTEAKSHAWIERYHCCTRCKIRSCRVIIAITWIITNIIVIIIISWDNLTTTYLDWGAVVAAGAILSISNFWLVLQICAPSRNVIWAFFLRRRILILLYFKSFVFVNLSVWIFSFLHFLYRWFIIIYCIIC